MGADGYPSAEQTPPLPAWCGQGAEREYTGVGPTGFLRELVCADDSPGWCTVQVGQTETWDQGTVTRTPLAVHVWPSDDHGDGLTAAEARELGPALIAAADRLTAAEACAS